MTQRWYVRAAVVALVALVGLGTAAGFARAQAPTPAPTSTPAVAPGYEPWAVIEFGAGSPPQLQQPLTDPAAAPDGKHHLVRDWVHNCMHEKGVGCWSHHNAYLCGSWKSECTFVFGSCRQFFGEPCLPGPPQPLMPPGYGPPPSYLPQPGYPAGAANSGYPATNYGMYPGKTGCPGCQ